METTTTTTKRRAERTDKPTPVRLTRYEARLIAEELHKLMKEDEEHAPMGELLTDVEAAAYLNMSKSFVNHNKERIPHVKIGRSVRYTKAGLSEFAKYNSRSVAS